MPFHTLLGQRLYGTVEILREMIGRHAVRHRALAPLILMLWMRMCRLRNRFERLVLLWERDRLPASRAPRLTPDEPRTPRPKPELRLPTAHGWLARLVNGTGGYGDHIAALLDDPDTRALVTAHPAAGRVLRPWAKMLGFPLPDYLKLPPRRRKPRAPRPRAEPKPMSRRAIGRMLSRMTGPELSAYLGPLPPHFPLAIPGLRKIRKKIAAG